MIVGVINSDGLMVFRRDLHGKIFGYLGLCQPQPQSEVRMANEDTRSGDPIKIHKEKRRD